MRKTTCYVCLMIILNLRITFIESSIAQPVFMKVIPSDSKNFTNVDGRLFFISNDSLWTSDGTADGTHFIKKTNESFSRFYDFKLGSFIYFTTIQPDGKTTLWKTDGTNNQFYSG